MVPNNKVSPPQIKTTIFLHGIGLVSFFIAFFLIMKFLNLVHITELRIINYVVLLLVGFYELKKLFNRGKNQLSYLQGFGTVFLTGILSFLLFSVFLYFYIKFDKELEKLFWEKIPIEPIYSSTIPAITIFFEGSAVSIIVALITMQYFRKYEEGEDQLFNKPST